MTKQLLLLRHGKAGWEDEQNGADIDKPLTPYGIDAINALGKRLKKRKLTIDALLCSPANRAQMTANLIAEALAPPQKKLQIEREIYDNTVEDLITVLASCKNTWQTVLLVGHNPSLSEFASQYSDDANICFSTGALYQLTFPVTEWTNLAPHSGQCTFSDVSGD